MLERSLKKEGTPTSWNRDFCEGVSCVPQLFLSLANVGAQVYCSPTRIYDHGPFAILVEALVFIFYTYPYTQGLTRNARVNTLLLTAK